MYAAAKVVFSHRFDEQLCLCRLCRGLYVVCGGREGDQMGEGRRTKGRACDTHQFHIGVAKRRVLEVPSGGCIRGTTVEELGGRQARVEGGSGCWVLGVPP